MEVRAGQDSESPRYLPPLQGGLEKRIAAPVRCKQKSPAGAGDLDSRFAFNGS